MIHIAGMKEWIIIEQLTSQKDNRGNAHEEWTEILHARAAVNVPTGSEVFTRHEYSSHSSGYEGSEFYGARQTLQESKIKFTMRYTKRLNNIDTTKYRVMWNDRVYNILSVDNIQAKNEKLIITAICKDGNLTITETDGENNG